MLTEMSDLVVHRAGGFWKWQMFLIGRWRSGKEEKPISPLTLSSTFQKKIVCVCLWLPECNSRLIYDFVGACKGEDMKQNLMLVARDNRKYLNSANLCSYINLKQILVLKIQFLNRNLLLLQILQKFKVLIKYGSWHISEVGNWEWFFGYIWTQGI